MNRPVLTDGRLGARPAQSLVDNVNRVELDDELAAAEQFVLIDLAHAVTLTRQGAFDPYQGQAIVSALVRLYKGSPEALLAGDPALGTIALQVESYLEHECGPAGLDIQRGRSRIDQKSTGVRMADRQGALRVAHATSRLAEALLAAAAVHDDVLTPGYTHLQHAQPTTLGHYFNAHYWAVARGTARVLDYLVRFDQCPLGGAAHSGTSWPIDRAATARYLGFAEPVPNARDAGLSAFDGGAELSSILGLVLSGVSRLAGDLFYWSSSEVGLVRLAPSLCGTSSMMPQKRNPMTLERIRGLAGEAVAWSANQLGSLHFATSTDADQSYVHNRVPGYCDEVVGALDMLADIVATLEVDQEAMSRSAGAQWATASALADDLVRTRGMSFRQAHDVVARFIAAHERASAESVTPALADGALQEYSSEQLATLLDPRTFVESRDSAGGTARAERQALAASAAKDLAAHATAVRRFEVAIEDGIRHLLQDADGITSGRAA